jgi:oligoribonuclease
MNKAKLLWIDLEMTGLDSTKDKIIEIGAIATDWDFNEIAQFESAVHVSDKIIKERMVGDFWVQNPESYKNLVKNSAGAPSSTKVEAELIAFVKANFDKDTMVYLAGNSIHQDRKFITNEWKKLDDILHYRMLDVSAWKIIFENKFGKKFHKPEAHRALSDIEGSIEELKDYIAYINL